MTSSAPGGATQRAAHAAPDPSRAKANPGWGLIVFGGLLGVLGAFLTWATVNYGGVATHTYRGVSGGRDGKITVVLSLLVLALTVLAFAGWASRRWMRPTLAILGLVIIFVAIADLAASPSAGSEVEVQLHAKVTSSNGVGEWLTLIAGILVVVGVVLVQRYSRPLGAAAPTSDLAASGGPAHAPAEAVAPSTGAVAASEPAGTAALQEKPAETESSAVLHDERTGEEGEPLGQPSAGDQPTGESAQDAGAS